MRKPRPVRPGSAHLAHIPPQDQEYKYHPELARDLARLCTQAREAGAAQEDLHPKNVMRDFGSGGQLVFVDPDLIQPCPDQSGVDTFPEVVRSYGETILATYLSDDIAPVGETLEQLMIDMNKRGVLQAYMPTRWSELIPHIDTEDPANFTDPETGLMTDLLEFAEEPVRRLLTERSVTKKADPRVIDFALSCLRDSTRPENLNEMLALE